MELKPVEAPLVRADGRDLAVRAPSEDREAGRGLDDLVAVAHPDLRPSGEPGEEAVRRRLEALRSVLARRSRRHLSAQRLRHRLHAVADAEHGNPKLVDPRVRPRSVLRVDGGRPPGEDDRARPRGNLLRGRVVTQNLRIDPALTHAPGDQMRVLGAEVEDEDGLSLHGRLERRIIPPAPGTTRATAPPVYSASVVARQPAPSSSEPSSSPAVRGARGSRPPFFVHRRRWKTLLGEFVVPAPSSRSGRRPTSLTRDGIVRALDQATGAVVWKAEGVSGRLSAVDGVCSRSPRTARRGSFQPRTGAVAGKTDTGVDGAAARGRDRRSAVVAGRASPRSIWPSESAALNDAVGAETTTPQSPRGSELLAGEKTARCAAATGPPASPLGPPHRRSAARPPLVDEARRRLYLRYQRQADPRGSLDKGKRLGLAGGAASPARACCSPGASSSRPTTPCSTPSTGEGTSPGAGPAGATPVGPPADRGIPAHRVPRERAGGARPGHRREDRQRPYIRRDPRLRRSWSEA